MGGRVWRRLGVDPDALRSFGWRAKTRTEHLQLVALSRRLPTTLELKKLDELLPARALERDSPTLLFRLAREYLISARVIRPEPVTVVARVAHAHAEARRETFARLAHEFGDARCAALDALPVTDPEVRTTRLRWLVTGPAEGSPNAPSGRGTWNYGLAFDSMRSAGRRIDDEIPARISPGHTARTSTSAAPLGRHRRRARPARPDRIPAAAGPRHPVLTRRPADSAG